MVKLLFIEIKTNLIKLYLGNLFLLLGGLFIFDASNLSHDRVTQFIELIFILLDIILFTSIYTIDKSKHSILVLNTKYYDYHLIFILRVVLTIVFITILITINLIILYVFNSSILITKNAFIAFTSSLFIGTLCLLISIIIHNALSGFMVGLVYFLLCLGFRNLGFIYLFSETFKYPFYIKVIQFILGSIGLITCDYWMKKRKFNTY
ncbi:hypothetical protein DMB77_08895 [Staphylococcus saccharolyticus]|nr:hypothetical protein DMB74_06455 [Staphylococcus saccharolyticus]TAA92598.1 hypothetical protein DMB77_08895 [Staphylococcus saccharolyticus]